MPAQLCVSLREQRPGLPQFIAIDTAVFGNLVLLVALDECGDVWQYQGFASQNFKTDGTWVRLGTGRLQGG